MKGHYWPISFSELPDYIDYLGQLSSNQLASSSFPQRSGSSYCRPSSNDLSYGSSFLGVFMSQAWLG